MGRLDVIGFGSLNLDEFWEVPEELLTEQGLRTGEEYIRDTPWFHLMYDQLSSRGIPKSVDPGGSAANTIAALKRMGFQTGFFGATGRADWSALRLEELGKIEDLRIIGTDSPAGRCLSLINRNDPQRDRCLVIIPNANDLVGQQWLERDYFSRARWVHFTSFVSTSPLLAQILVVENLGTETLVSFDPGAVYARLGLEALLPILRRTSILFVSVEELLLLTGRDNPQKGVADILDLGTRQVILKRGAEGIQLFSALESVFQASIPPRRIVDRTGAGDVAAAGFLAGILMALDTQKSLLLAAMAASRSIEGYGRSAYPDHVFLRRFLASQLNGN